MRLLRFVPGLVVMPAVLSAVTANAQIVRGIVVDGADIPVPGVLVQLIDASSHLTGRAVTNERGEFVLGAAAGNYRIHTLRIGFRPSDSPAITISAGTEVRRRIVLAGLPLQLDTVLVAAHNTCRSLSDSGASLAVWEQIHAAISAASLTAAARNVFTTTISYERTLEPDLRTIRTQKSAIQSGYVREPWATRSADALHSNGYVLTDRDNVTTYYAPGLEVLLSPSFIEDHCFRLASGNGRLGLVFEPTPDRHEVPEIRGTLWLDPRTAELKSLEFGYANVLAEQQAVAQGHADFMHVANGMWAISKWNIRMPLLERSVRSFGREADEVKVVAVRVVGGDLVLARRGTDTLWTRPLVTVSGMVVDSMSGERIARARVNLVGTNLVDSTDSQGRFSIAGVLLGQYTMDVRTPSLDSIGAFHEVRIDLADSAAAIRVRVPSGVQLISLLCGDIKLEWPGVLVGAVAAGDDSISPANAVVTAAWTQAFVPVGGQTVAAIGARRDWRDTRTDTHGAFRLCGVPVDKPIDLSVGSGSGVPVVVRIPANRRLIRATLTLARNSPNDFAAFVGTVTDSAGYSLAAADVSLPDLSKAALTDAGGSFRIDGVPVGQQRVLVRRIGYRAIDTSLTFMAGRTVPRRFELSSAVTLDSVVVTETATDKRLQTFDENRRLGLGQFLSRADLAKLEGGPSTSSILAIFSGLGVARGMGHHAWITSAHGTRGVLPDDASVSLGAKRACYAQVYLDNVEIYSGRDNEPLFDANSIPANEIEAIEYYATPAQMPARYNNLNSTCGVLVLWTIRRHSER